MVLVSDKPSTILVFYRLNSAIERGTKPDALGWKPCHWTSTLKAAMVNAKRACKYAQPRCITFFKWQTSVSIEGTVSTSIRSSHSPRGHSLRLLGSPSAAWKAVSLKTDHASVDLANQPLKGVIGDIGCGTVPPHDQPPLIDSRQSLPPTIH